MKDRLVIKALSCSAWAMLPSAFKQLCQIVGRHASGQPIPAAALEAVRSAQAAAAGEPQPEEGEPFLRVGGAAVIPIRGTLIRRADAFDRVSGATDPEDLRATFRAALNDPEVERIVLDIDSPGGSVDGIDEFAEEIRAGRDRKPVIAVANSLAASAGYWIGAQAGEFYVSSGGMVGSIGVIRMDVDPRKALEAMGFDLETVSSAELKNARGLNSDKTVSQVLASTQDLQQWHALFVDAVAAGRGIDREQAEQLADGRVAVGRAAVAEGFVDGVRSLEQILDSETSSKEDRMAVKTKGGAAASRTPAPALAEETVEVTVTESQDEEDDDEEKDDEMEEDGKAEAKPEASAKSKGRRSAAKTFDRGVTAERERQKAIRGMACAGQEDLAEQLVDDGATVADARVKLHDDLRAQASAREHQRGDDYAPLTTAADRQAAARAAAEPPAGESKPKDAIEAEARRKWNANARLRAMFGESFECYLAECYGVAKGNIRSHVPSEN